MRGISLFTRDEPYCEIINFISEYNIQKGEYIIHDDGYFYPKPEEEFDGMFEKVECVAEADYDWI